ncbi:MAG: GNAT family N-acetyltransferase [Leptolyngbya sp. SIO1D8]|nr:GNAT family N-acetyltransferase [Leptolyngbya sp. SIO1D8]
MLQVPSHFESDRLVLRKFREQDASDVFNQYAGNPKATKFVSWPTHKTLEDTRNYLKYAIDSWDKGTDHSYAIIEKTSQNLIGGTGFVNEDGKVYLGYILAVSAWGKGYATEATQTLAEWLRQQPEIYRVWAVCDTEHRSSARVLEKSGFVREALITNWCRFPNQENRPKDCFFYVLS